MPGRIGHMRKRYRTESASKGTDAETNRPHKEPMPGRTGIVRSRRRNKGPIPDRTGFVTDGCPFLSVSVRFGVRFGLFLSVFVRFCPFLSVSVRFGLRASA